MLNECGAASAERRWLDSRLAGKDLGPLRTGNGCLSDPPTTNVGKTTHQVAKQLARLPQSTILQSPTTMRAFGHEAVHLRLRVNRQRCGHDIYRVAESLRGDHGIP